MTDPITHMKVEVVPTGIGTAEVYVNGENWSNHVLADGIHVEYAPPSQGRPRVTLSILADEIITDELVTRGPR